jgi:carboxyl-terminal processing protease
MPLRHRLALFVAAWVLVSTCLVPAASRAELSTKLYVGHAARLTAQIPHDWTVDPTGTYDYVGEYGFVVSEPVAGRTLDEACANVAASPRFEDGATVAETAWAEEEACRIDGESKSEDVAALVVPHPFAFEIWGERYSYAALLSDPNDLPALAASLNFSPDAVTPEVYISSLIDIVEARAYWADEVDWTLARQEALAAVEGLPTVELAHGALFSVVQKLRAVGDNHSFLRLPDQVKTVSESNGYGFLVGGQQIPIVFSDGPADRAGVRVGDIIENVNGEPFLPTMTPIDPATLASVNSASGWGLSTQLTLRRSGMQDTITVSVKQGSYSLYLPPTGRRLMGGLGYIEVPYFVTPGQEKAYASTANGVLATIDQHPTCGWIVDLRLDAGGSYSPMVTGVGPILGNGTFVGWRWADGKQSWVTYMDGRISDDGQEVSDYLPGEIYDLQRSGPPVAVLIGPMTRSSGEVAALAFVGRPRARLFGQSTGGYTTANVDYSLFDGTHLALAVAAMTDRSGATHSDGVQPEEFVPFDWAQYGTEDDPVLNAAIEWLNQQPECASAASIVLR